MPRYSCLHAPFLISKTKNQSSWVLSRDLYWENKMYKRKRSILCRPSGLESMYTKTRLKAPEKSWRGCQFAVFIKYPDFSRLRNEIRMRFLVPRERNYHMTGTASHALSLQSYWESPRMRAVRDGSSRAALKSRPALVGSRTALCEMRTETTLLLYKSLAT